MKNPRIAVTVTEAQYETLKRLATVNGQSMSRVVAELIESVEPVLGRVADLCEFAEKAREEQRFILRSSMEETQAELEPLLLRALKVLGVGPEDAGKALQAGSSKAAAETQGRGGSRRLRRAGKPPSGNHGGQVGERGEA